MMLLNHTREPAVAAKRLDSHPNMPHRGSNNSDTAAARHTPAPHTREPARRNTDAVQGRFLRACRQSMPPRSPPATPAATWPLSARATTGSVHKGRATLAAKSIKMRFFIVLSNGPTGLAKLKNTAALVYDK